MARRKRRTFEERRIGFLFQKNLKMQKEAVRKATLLKALCAFNEDDAIAKKDLVRAELARQTSKICDQLLALYGGTNEKQQHLQSLLRIPHGEGMD